MMPLRHIIYSFIFCLFFFVILSYGDVFPYILIFLSSILIDIDHYFPYIVKRKFNLIRNYKEEVILRKKFIPSNKRKKEILLFHGIEFVLVLIVLSFFFNFFIFVLLGILMHLLLDISELIRYNKQPFFKLSQIYNYLSIKKEKFSKPQF
jgi:hypothetical protein